MVRNRVRYARANSNHNGRSFSNAPCREGIATHGDGDQVPSQHHLDDEITRLHRRGGRKFDDGVMGGIEPGDPIVDDQIASYVTAAGDVNDRRAVRQETTGCQHSGEIC